MFLTSSVFFALSLAITASYGLPRSVPIDGRIVGGRNALVGELPHQVVLRTVAENRFFCGGAIIAQTWTLSAAHCVIGRPQNGIFVVAGTLTLDAGGDVYQCSRFIMHPGYDAATLAYDVTVIQNQVPFVYNDLVSPIALGTTTIGGGVEGIISGWGGTGHTGPPMPNDLQVLNVTTLTNPDCRSRHIESNAARISDHKICTYNRFGFGACFGDSGGALVINNAMIGIVAWGHEGCATGWPDVFVRVSEVHSWIVDTMNS